MKSPDSTPSSATSVSGPIGLSMTVCVRMCLLRRKPVDLHVPGLRRHHRATRAAVHAGGPHSDEEPPVEPGVLRLHRTHATIGVLEHAASMAAATDRTSRKCDSYDVDVRIRPDCVRGG